MTRITEAPHFLPQFNPMATGYNPQKPFYQMSTNSQVSSFHPKYSYSIENSAKSGRRRYLRWKAEDTALVIKSFAKYICYEDEGCKGQLPGKGTISLYCPYRQSMSWKYFNTFY